MAGLIDIELLSPRIAKYQESPDFFLTTIDRFLENTFKIQFQIHFISKLTLMIVKNFAILTLS